MQVFGSPEASIPAHARTASLLLWSIMHWDRASAVAGELPQGLHWGLGFSDVTAALDLATLVSY